MKNLLFENFSLMFSVALIVSAVVFYYATQRRTRKLMLSAKIVPTIFLALLAVNHFVVTDRQAIRGQLDKLIAACREGDAAKLEPLIDEQFTAQGLSKPELLAHAKEAFANLSFEQITLTKIDNDPPPPVVRIISYTHMVSRSGADLGRIRSDWELTFRKVDDVWLLYELRPLSIMAQPVGDIRELLNRSRTIH